MLGALPLARRARTIVSELHRSTGRTVSLAILDGADVLYLQRLCGFAQGQYVLERGLGTGSRRPAHRAAAGRALLASPSSHSRPGSTKPDYANGPAGSPHPDCGHSSHADWTKRWHTRHERDRRDLLLGALQPASRRRMTARPPAERPRHDPSRPQPGLGASTRAAVAGPICGDSPEGESGLPGHKPVELRSPERLRVARVAQIGDRPRGRGVETVSAVSAHPSACTCAWSSRARAAPPRRAS